MASIKALHPKALPSIAGALQCRTMMRLTHSQSYMALCALQWARDAAAEALDARSLSSA